jgi:nitroreductase
VEYAREKEDTVMDVLEAIRTLLAVRSYEDRPVPDEVVREIVEAAHLTASSMNMQPWHFVVVQDRDSLRQLGSLVRTGPYIAQAPLAVAVATEKNSPFGVSDGSRAIQDMMLAAWARGMGSNWTGFGGLDGVRDFLGIPQEMDVLAVIPFGYPAQSVGRGKKQRKPLGDVASRERYGEPFQ